MLRGSRKIQALTTAINPEAAGELFPDTTTLYDKKVECMIARYVHHMSKGTRYDVILVKLQEEFFISTGRIADILTDKSEEIKKLRSEAPKRTRFQMQWTHLVW